MLTANMVMSTGCQLVREQMVPAQPLPWLHVNIH
jgi:hypothetical protein